MTKYSSEFKIKVVKEYLRGKISYQDLARKYQVLSKSNIQAWVAQAKKHGLESLMVKRSSTKYSQEFKLSVVDYVQIHEVSRQQTAAHFGISPSQVNSWVRVVKREGVAGLRPRPRGRRPTMGKHKKPTKLGKRLEPTQEEKYQQEILELKQKLHKAELDRDILKALATITRRSQANNPRK